MKKQKKIKWTNLPTILLVTVLSLGACKKTEKADDPVNDAKTWYINSTANSKVGLSKSNSGTTLKSNKGAIQLVSHTIHWNKSKAYTLSDGTDLVSVPMTVKIEGAGKTNGDFLMLLARTGNDYSSIVAYNENKDYFQKNFSLSEMQAIYLGTVAKNIEKSARKKGSGTNVMTLPAEQVCIDWYWTTYLYDQWGNIIDILSEVYLYTTCTEPGGGGGGGGEPTLDDEEEMNKILKDTEPHEATSSVSSYFVQLSSDGKERQEAYKWSIAHNPYSGYVVWSHETGTHEKVGSNWQWKALAHNNFSVAGKPSYMTVDVTLDGQPIPVLGVTTAGISVKCTITASVIFKGSPFGYPSTPFEKNSPVFYINP